MGEQILPIEDLQRQCRWICVDCRADMRLRDVEHRLPAVLLSDDTINLMPRRCICLVDETKLAPIAAAPNNFATHRD